MGRRDEWQQVRDSMFQQATTSRTVQDREFLPDVACGICRNFCENAYASDGRGACNILKFGSDITKDPPVLVMEGDTGLITFFNTDGSRCPYFNKMDLIDTDGKECADPAYRRMQRQIEKHSK